MNERPRAILAMPDGEPGPSLDDAAKARADNDIVAVLGSSGGWYAALAAAGVLSRDEVERLVGELASVQAELGTRAEQLVFPLGDASWHPDPALEDALNSALRHGDGEVHPTSELGAYAVISGTGEGIRALASALPEVAVGERHYPFLLPPGPALQMPAAEPLASELRVRLHDLDWRRPTVTLIDGRGVRHTPWSADPAALRDYTFGPQLVDTYRFATAFRVALREQAPDIVIVPGSGARLAAICGQLIVAEGYRGIRSRRAFVATQQRSPIVLSMRH